MVSVGAVRDLEQGRTVRPRRETTEAVARVLGLKQDEAAGEPVSPAPLAASSLRLGVLGPLTVWRDGTAISAGTGQQRVMLALLALHAGTAQHRETLIDAIWGEHPPASAVTMVQTYASRLRRLLGERMLLSDGTSYTLAVAPAQLDTAEFGLLAERAAESTAAGTPAAACDIYERAMQLWRGDPLADMPGLRELPAVAGIMLHKARVTADFAEAAVAAGLPERVLPHVRVLAAAYPLDERVHARLMLTLAACGQQAAALAAFDELRQRLDEDLGIAPGAELRDAHLRVLRGQLRETSAPGPRQEPAAQCPRQLPVAVAPFIGRADEMATLTEMADRPGAPGSAAISVVSGMAGVGKTALAVHWAHRIASRFPDGQLYADLRGFAVSDAPVSADEAIRGFLDALGVPAGEIPAGVEAQAGLYRGLLAGRRMLIVLDNARDEQQVRPLLPAAPGCLAIITSRSQLTGLAAAEGACVLALDVLSPAHARELLTSRLGSRFTAPESGSGSGTGARPGSGTPSGSRALASVEPGSVAEIADLCGGLPLALAVAAARALTRPRVPAAALAAELRDDASRLDVLGTADPAVNIRTVFSWSTRQLSATAARMSRLLGMHPGPDIAIPAAASLCGLQPAQARRDLSELAGAHLVIEHAAGRYMIHDLLHAYAAEEVRARETVSERDAATGRLLDHYLRTAREAAWVLSPALARSGPQPPRPPRFGNWRQAWAWYEAEHHVLIAAINLANETGFDTCAWQLAAAIARFLEWRGYWHDWGATQQIALRAATHAGDKDGQAQACYLLGRARINLADLDGARAYLAQSLELYRQLRDVRGQSQAHVSLCLACGSQGSRNEALQHGELALRLCQSIADRPLRALICNNLGCAHVDLGDGRRAVTLAQQAVGLFRELGDVQGEALAWGSLASAEQYLGCYSEAIESYHQALRYFHGPGNRPCEAHALAGLGDAHCALGNARSAQDAWRAALDILEELHHPDAGRVRAKVNSTAIP